MARLLESTFLSGPAGRLEALHEGPEEGAEIRKAALVCHPHPLYGGTMHNKVVFRLARAARKAGAAVLRFNFRGVGRSAGSHDGGDGERDDVRAGLDYLSERYAGIPLSVAGFSFGARVGLEACCGESRVERFVAAGTPVNHGKWDFLAHCPLPKVFLHSVADEHGSRDKMESVLASATEPKSITWIEASDHFFNGGLDELEQAAYEIFSGD